MKTANVGIPLLLWALLGFSPPAARGNCGAEGCPLAPRGPEVTLGRLSFNMSYQTIEQDRIWEGGREIPAAHALQAEGGVGHVLEQLTRTHTTLFQADARLTRRVALSLSVPYVDRIHRHAIEHHAGFFIESEWHMRGLGDATTIASWTLLDGSRPGSGTLVVQAGAKLATGKTNVAEINGDVPEPSARPGSGSTDGIVGLHYRRSVALPALWGPRSPTPLTASVGARFNGKGSEGYRMGNEWDVSLGSAYPVGRRLRLLAQLNASRHARDEAGNTDAVPHNTGNSALYASPGALVQIVTGMSAFGYYQFRLYEHSNGPQLVSPYHLSFGIAYAVR